MSAAVVYDGVGGRGDLFAGKKFFFLHRVPQRDQWRALVRSNGGQVMDLDKLADVVIADHARKDSPPGSISWTYIQKSVQKGRLEYEENHRAGPTLHQARAVGSTLPTRIGRTPFTAEDDRILWEWVIRAERKGVSNKGNELYKQLEAKHPRHTYQSWRDRFIKKLAFEPRPQISEEESDDEVEEVAIPSAPVRLPKPASNSNFTKEDDQLLSEAYDSIMNLDVDRAIEAWETWADEYPQHTAQQWRNRFEAHIKTKKSPLPAEEPSSQSQGNERPKANTSRKPSAPTGVETTNKEVERARRQKEERKATDSTVVEEERMFRKDLQAFVDAETHKDPEMNLKLTFRPIIGGRQVPLFRIWQAITSPRFGGYDVVEAKNLWPLVAEELNFNRFRDHAAPKQLKTCYEDMLLAEFEDFKGLVKFVNEDITESQEDRMIESQLRREAEEVDRKHIETSKSTIRSREESLESFGQAQRLPSSGPKRGIDWDMPQDDQMTSKRPRVDKWKGKEPEIPSTPEEVLRKTQHAKLPSQHTPRRQYSSPLARESEEEELLKTPSRKPKSGFTSRVGKSTSTLPAEDDTAAQAASELQDEEVERVVNEYVAKGYAASVVAEALEATTMETGDLHQVIKSIQSGRGIPSNIQGVWTAGDDEALVTPRGLAYKRILTKHGQDRVGRRQQFKEDQRDDSDVFEA